MTEIKKDTSEKVSTEVNKISIPNKLLEFQKRVSAISKDSVNPFFKSKYFDVNTVIDTIKPVLNEVGLVVAQPFGITPDGRNILRTEIWDDGKIVTHSQVYLPEIADVQKFGAAVTYFRRYALVSLLLLQGEEDDDGNATSATNSQKINSKPIISPKPTQTASKAEPFPISENNAYKTWSDKIKAVTTLDELNGYQENLKFVTKTMKSGEVALLRSEFANKRKELESEIII